MLSETENNIDRFLAGIMPPVERQAFEAEMAKNPDLVRAVNLTRLVKRTVEDGNRHALRQQIVTELRWRRRLPYLYGAGLLLFLLTLFLIFRPSGHVAVASPAQPIADRYFHRPTLEGNLSDAKDEAGRRFIGAKKSFEKGACAEAQPVLRQLLDHPDFPDKNILLLMRGCCYFEQQEQLDSAILSFQQILLTVTPDTEMGQHAQWYLALAQFKKDQQDAGARAAIQQIAADPEHLHYVEALALTKEW